MGERHAAKAGAEIRERGDLELDFRVVGEGVIVEFLVSAHETHETHEPGRNEEDFLSGD